MNARVLLAILALAAAGGGAGCHTPLGVAVALPEDLSAVSAENLAYSWRIRRRPEIEAELTRRGLVPESEWPAIRAGDLERVESRVGRWCVLGVPFDRPPRVEIREGRIYGLPEAER